MAKEQKRNRGFMPKIAHLIVIIWIQIGLTLVLFWIVSMASGLLVEAIASCAGSCA